MTDPADDGEALDVVVSNNEAAQQYEARVAGELAGLTTYVLHDNRVVFTHAETDPRWEGQGVASALARGALDDVMAQGKLITPLCPFIVSYVRRHPAYLSHVDAAHRGKIGATIADESTNSDGS